MHFEDLEAWMAGDSMMAVIQQEGRRDGRSDGGNGTTEEELHTCKSGKGKVTIMEKDYIHVCYMALNSLTSLSFNAPNELRLAMHV